LKAQEESEVYDCFCTTHTNKAQAVYDRVEAQMENSKPLERIVDDLGKPQSFEDQLIDKVIDSYKVGKIETVTDFFKLNYDLSRATWKKLYPHRAKLETALKEFRLMHNDEDLVPKPMIETLKDFVENPNSEFYDYF